MSQENYKDCIVSFNGGKNTFKVLIDKPGELLVQLDGTEDAENRWNADKHRDKMKVLKRPDEVEVVYTTEKSGEDPPPAPVAPVKQEVNQIAAHVKEITGAELQQPEQPLIKIRFELDGRELQEVVDSILMIRWDSVEKSHELDEVEKHLGLIPYYFGVVAAAARDAEIRKAKAEGIVESHMAQHKEDLRSRIIARRQIEKDQKIRGTIGQITKQDMQDELMSDPGLYETYEKGRLLLEYAKSDIKLLRDLLKTLDMKNMSLQAILKRMTQTGYAQM